MALVPFKNLLRFLQKKCSKHFKIDQKDMSRVAKFVSHDGITLIISIENELEAFPIKIYWMKPLLMCTKVLR